MFDVDSPRLLPTGVWMAGAMALVALVALPDPSGPELESLSDRGTFLAIENPPSTIPPCSLTLTVEKESSPGCYFGSLFANGSLDQCVDGRTELSKGYASLDGCTWHATETLIPEGPGQFRYTYTEVAVSCPEGHRPSRPCSRTGIVVLK